MRAAMEWRRGQVARSLAGHDKGTFLAVLEVAPPYAVVAPENNFSRICHYLL